MTQPTQEELRNFVRNNIGSCQSSLVDKLLAEEVFNWEDVTNLYVWKCKECGDAMLIDVDSVYKCQSCKMAQEEEPEQEPQEIFEWWIVGDWFAKKLLAQGEPVLQNDYGTWWGRTCTGQAISLDSVVETIYTSL